MSLTTILLPLVGFLIGVLTAIMGGGGGIFYVGILTAGFHIPGPIAAATSLATIIPTTAVASLSHWRTGNVRAGLAGWMIAGGVVGAVLGSLVSTRLPVGLYARIFGVFMLAMGIQMAISGRRDRAASRSGTVRGGSGTADAGERPVRRWPAVGYGTLGGLMSGLLGVSGTPPILSGLVLLGCTAAEVVGTSVLVLLGISTIGFLSHLGLGDVDWTLVLELAIGTVTGAFVGPRLMRRIPRSALDSVYGPFFLIMTLGMGLVLLIRGA